MRQIIEKIIDRYLLPNKHFQNYIKWRSAFWQGPEFLPHVQNHTIFDVLNDYKFQDIRPTDIVLDIGANVGGFSLFASKRAKRVFAVEPLYTDILSNNITLNNIKNITILRMALGTGEDAVIKYGRKEAVIGTSPLSEIIKVCGGEVGFLKMDCEGSEWLIQQNEIKNIRRIEAEIHNFDGNHDCTRFLDILNGAGFECEHSYQLTNNNWNKNLMTVHAINKNA